MIMNKNDKAHNYERCVTYYEISDGRKLLWVVSRKDYEWSVPLQHIKDEIKEGTILYFDSVHDNMT